ncbi:MAG: response regulator transcription factor, partial [Anaerolineales bacterium]
MTAKIRVIVADDHAIVRDGISSLLSTEPDIEVVAEATNGREAVELSKRHKPDIVLMDLMMPEMDGVEATKAIRAGASNTRVLVLTSFAAEDRLLPALRAGAQGYLLKQSGAEDLVGAIQLVHSGGSSLDPAVAGKVLQELAKESGPS